MDVKLQYEKLPPSDLLDISAGATSSSVSSAKADCSDLELAATAFVSFE